MPENDFDAAQSLMQALRRAITLAEMEWNMSRAEAVGCLEFMKQEIMAEEDETGGKHNES